MAERDSTVELTAVTCFFRSATNDRRVGIVSISSRLMFSSRFWTSEVSWSRRSLTDSSSSRSLVGPSPPPWTISMMNFSLSAVAVAMRDSNSSFLFRTSSSLSVSSSSIRLLELSFSRSSDILLDVWTALSQLSCPSSWLNLTRSFLCSSRRSSWDFISPVLASSIWSLVSACESCFWASAFLSSNFDIPTTSSIIFRFSSGVRSATLVAAPCGMTLSPLGERPETSRKSAIMLLVDFFPFR